MSSSLSEHCFVFVPGMSSIGSIVYEPLLQTLTSLGHSADSLHVINNASVVPDLTDPPQFNGNALQKDIHQIRDALLKLITEQHRDVVLVAHSYGGTPAIYAASGLWQHQRAAARRAGGVVKVALIASSLTLPGGSVAGDRAEWQKANGQPGDEGAEIQVVDGEPYLIPTGFEHVWMNDITDSAIRASLKPSAMSSVLSLTPTDLDDPTNWRLAYLILTDLDLGMPEPLQRHLIERARAAGAKVDEGTLKSGHFAQVSHPREVAGWLRGLV